MAATESVEVPPTIKPEETVEKKTAELAATESVEVPPTIEPAETVAKPQADISSEEKDVTT